MKPEDIKMLSRISQPEPDSNGFIEDMKSPIPYHFKKGDGCPAGLTRDCMKAGVEIAIDFCDETGNLDTAFMSLRRVLKAKGILEKKGGYPLKFISDKSLSHEEYIVDVQPEGGMVAASDADGMRRGVYFLEDRICEAEGASATCGKWRRRPFVKHRVSRCFFGPTYRYPHFIDELANDVDYYPDEYLNKLAHEGINGLWLTMYFRDLPSEILPDRGKDHEKRFAKLRLTVERCARFGIRIYVFLSEPKLFGNAHFTIPLETTKKHPEIAGAGHDGYTMFCTSSENGKKYLRESITRIFSAVPSLGGVINIMLGEDNGSCAAVMTLEEHPDHGCTRCGHRDMADIYRELAELFTDAIHKINPEAEFIGWFYVPGLKEGSELMRRLEKIADKWPDNSGIMFNFESGGIEKQLGKNRNVFDYSLAYVGPSKLFHQIAAKKSKVGAKLQVGCAWEDASIPFIPVPENLYDKYKTMNKYGVYAAMQCWYFGNYPGIMNKAAGELSFEPFPRSSDEFLESLARPYWRKNTPKVVGAWKYFSKGYRKFPANLAFSWFGPLHRSIAWPLYLFPVDEPISPSWSLKRFPEITGDRVGECLGFQHTLYEAISLCREMSQAWMMGVDILESFRHDYPDNPERIADINLAGAIGLQMRSALNFLNFYSLREGMFYRRKNNLDAMKAVVLDEIVNSKIMIELCEQDPRLGYQPEAEDYLFSAMKIRSRVELLERLLSDEFPKFSLDAGFIDEYTGAKPKGSKTLCRKESDGEPVRQTICEDMGWSSYYSDENLYVVVDGVKGRAFSIEIEPCRLWPPLRVDFKENGKTEQDNFLEVDLKYVREEGKITTMIPLRTFDGIRREGFPMRINVWGKDFAWVERNPYPRRLLYGDFNPKCAGWLIFDTSSK